MQENKENKRNYKVVNWGAEYNIIPLQEREFVNDSIVLECKCGSTYTGKSFPKYKWDQDKEEMIKCGISIDKYYNSKNSQKHDYLTCNCGERFTNMTCIYPKEIKYLVPSIRTSDKKDLQLDYSYLEDEDKNKHWSDLPGGIQEYEDVHKERFQGQNGVIDIT
jgi:hypothetical protein